MPPEEAETMMELLPNITWNDIATKHDVASLGTNLRGGIAELRGELKADVAAVRGELAEVRGDISQQTRLMILGLIGSQATFVGLILASDLLG